MDKEKAEALARVLIGTDLDGWTIERYVDHGKSAAVFSAHKDGQLAAIKIFDTELIERYGDQTQLERINRELTLRGKTHENLVSIYGGGYEKSHNLYFVVMEFLDGPNLKKALPTIQPDEIPELIQQLASAAKYLEELGLVHRDIKPENIALLEGGRRLVLLDLGVIRPIKGSDLTDPEGVRAFIGTLQYSSPEFLLRDERQDLEGFRALTFYQIGAVLHDLIMKRPIFEKFCDPYAKLVLAVQREQPIVANPEVAPQLVDLARKCLLKAPSTRLRLVRWDSFNVADQKKTTTARERVTDRLATLRAQDHEARAAQEEPEFNSAHIKKNVLATINLAARTARAAVPGLPPIHQRTCTDGTELIFDPNPNAGMLHGLVVRVRARVIDPAENVVSCTGCAFFPSNLDPIVVATNLETAWYEGVFENVALIAAFESFFFGATEWCLAVSPGIQTGMTATYPTAPGDQHG